MSDRATRRHEGAHVAAALWFGGRPIKCVRVDDPEVDTAGKVDLGREREFEAVDLITHLIG